jgi:hypothetical protein
MSDDKPQDVISFRQGSSTDERNPDGSWVLSDDQLIEIFGSSLANDMIAARENAKPRSSGETLRVNAVDQKRSVISFGARKT